MATKAKKKYTYLTKAIQLPDGTRKYIRGKDQKELEEKVLKAQIMVNAGVDICSEETFGHFAQMWYDIYKKPYLRENSQNAIKYVMNQHILPYIGGYRLRDISPMQIQSIMAALSDKSNSLQSKVLIALRSIFKAAQENGLVAKSPVSSMLKPSGKRSAEKVALTPQESDLLLQRVKNDRVVGHDHLTLLCGGFLHHLRGDVQRRQHPVHRAAAVHQQAGIVPAFGQFQRRDGLHCFVYLPYCYHRSVPSFKIASISAASSLPSGTPRRIRGSFAFCQSA